MVAGAADACYGVAYVLITSSGVYEFHLYLLVSWMFSAANWKPRSCACGKPAAPQPLSPERALGSVTKIC